MHIDLQPDLSADQIEQRLRVGRPKDSLTTALRRSVSLAPSSIGLLRESVSNDPPTDPGTLARLIKSVKFTIDTTMSVDRAISTAGGVALSEVDACFMLQKGPSAIGLSGVQRFAYLLLQLRLRLFFQIAITYRDFQIAITHRDSRLRLPIGIPDSNYLLGFQIAITYRDSR